MEDGLEIKEDDMEIMEDDQKCLENIQKEKVRLKIQLGQLWTDPVLVDLEIKEDDMEMLKDDQKCLEGQIKNLIGPVLYRSCTCFLI
jgi:hypothetical protein